jgi:guanosine-3',5'-bis(diphosphate) 3'-pyrophosphohydrolase
MIDADDLLSLVRNYNPKTNEALIRGAYDYARRMHEGQNAIRASPISPIRSPLPPS